MLFSIDELFINLVRKTEQIMVRAHIRNQPQGGTDEDGTSRIGLVINDDRLCFIRDNLVKRRKETNSPENPRSAISELPFLR